MSLWGFSRVFILDPLPCLTWFREEWKIQVAALGPSPCLVVSSAVSGLIPILGSLSMETG